MKYIFSHVKIFIFGGGLNNKLNLLWWGKFFLMHCWWGKNGKVPILLHIFLFVWIIWGHLFGRPYRCNGTKFRLDTALLGSFFPPLSLVIVLTTAFQEEIKVICVVVIAVFVNAVN